MNADNITENLLDAINVIVEEKIKKLNFDKTYKAIVISTDKRNKGRYGCETNGLKYEAIGAPNEQLIGDIVYVNVPQNNWDRQKNIIGKSVMDKNSINLYSPFSYFYCPSNEPFQSQKFNFTEGGVTQFPFYVTANENYYNQETIINNIHKYEKKNSEATPPIPLINYSIGDKVFVQQGGNNSPKIYYICIKQPTTNENDFSYSSENWEFYDISAPIRKEYYTEDYLLQNYKEYAYTEPFDAIGIKVKIDTTELGINFNNKIVSGQYGIKINFLNSNNQIINSYDFNNTQMIGNVYNSKSALREQVFYIEKSVFNASEKIGLELYENEDFKYTENGETIPISQNESHPFPSQGNIKVESIELYFGYDLKNFKELELRLDTNDIKQYFEGRPERDNTKTFFHSFLYRDENGKIQKDDELVSSFWYCIGYDDGGWTQIETQPNNKQKYLTYFISQDQAASATNVFRFKIQLEWQNTLINSNIVTLYKYT